MQIATASAYTLASQIQLVVTQINTTGHKQIDKIYNKS